MRQTLGGGTTIGGALQRTAVGIALLLSWPGAVLGQQTRVVHPFPQDSLAGSYRIYEPAGKAVGVLVLLPGGAASYDEFQADGSTPSTLPQQLSEHQMVTIVPSAEGFPASSPAAIELISARSCGGLHGTRLQVPDGGWKIHNADCHGCSSILIEPAVAAAGGPHQG